MPKKITTEDVRAIFPEVDLIQNAKLRNAVCEIWQEISAEMAWDDLMEIPKSPTKESKRSLVSHLRGVTQAALAIGEALHKIQDKPFDRDIVVAGGLLHDVSKPLENEPDPEGPRHGILRAGRKSAMGKLIQHPVYGVHKAFAKGLPPEIAHIMLSHTMNSNVRGKTWEAALVFYADYIESDAFLSSTGMPMYLSRWQLPKKDR